MTFPVRRLIKFEYSASIVYLLEFGDSYIRVYYADEYITTVTTPYLEADLFALQTKQIGDVMRIVHPKYAPRKLSRTTATDFSLDLIDFTDGPFMTRNDLLDPLNTSPSTMSCSSLTPGSYGTLTCTSAIFATKHVGCLFELTHDRVTSTVSTTGTTISSPMYVSGSLRFITRGTWTGTVLVERNENGAGWETFRTYKGATGAEQNVSWTIIENGNNVQFRINPSGSAGGFNADLSCEDLYSTGVVKVIFYGNTKTVTIQVVSRIEATTATRRWAEGSFSDYRGWPASLTFFEDRCVYAGALSASDASVGSEIMYPTLKTANYGNL
jgi:hypothetical protein